MILSFMCFECTIVSIFVVLVLILRFKMKVCEDHYSPPTIHSLFLDLCMHALIFAIIECLQILAFFKRLQSLKLHYKCRD